MRRRRRSNLMFARRRRFFFSVRRVSYYSMVLAVGSSVYAASSTEETGPGSSRQQLRFRRDFPPSPPRALSRSLRQEGGGAISSGRRIPKEKKISWHQTPPIYTGSQIVLNYMYFDVQITLRKIFMAQESVQATRSSGNLVFVYKNFIGCSSIIKGLRLKIAMEARSVLLFFTFFTQ